MSDDLDERIENDNENLQILPRKLVSSDQPCITNLLSHLHLKDNNTRAGSQSRRNRNDRRKQPLTRLTDQGSSKPRGHFSAESLFRTADSVFTQRRKDRREKPKTMSYADMCMRDSHALAQECPDTFGQVHVESFSLADAVKLANQLNTTLPKLPKKDMIMSKDQRIPVKNKQDGLLNFEASKPSVAETVEEKEEEKLPFDFSENAKTLSNVYEHVEVSKEKEEQVDEVRQKYMDILASLKQEVQNNASTRSKSKDVREEGVDNVAVDDTQQQGNGTIINEHEDENRPSLYPNVIRIFAVEYKKNATKNSFKFRTCSLSAAWKEHLENDPSNLHWYEILRARFPCHLYFDLEYPKHESLNADVDGDALVDRLIEYTRARMKTDFDLAILDGDIYELDSTTDQKFSRHLIIKVPGYAFYSSYVAGEFVRQVCADSGSSLLVKNRDGSTTYFVDTAVYTNNRLFRLAYSCKVGKTNNLMPTRRFAMAKTPRHTPAAVFRETLVTSVDAASSLLLVRPLISMSMGTQCETSEVIQQRRGVKRDHEFSFLPNKAAIAKLETLAHAAIPTIEKYASHRAGDRSVFVKNYQICGGYGTVAYSLDGDGAHFCSNHGGDHKSNYVYIVANFFTRRMAQKCYDPDCDTYKSPSHEMPEMFRWDPDQYNES